MVEGLGVIASVDHFELLEKVPEFDFYRTDYPVGKNSADRCEAHSHVYDVLAIYMLDIRLCCHPHASHPVAEPGELLFPDFRELGKAISAQSGSVSMAQYGQCRIPCAGTLGSGSAQRSQRWRVPAHEIEACYVCPYWAESGPQIPYRGHGVTAEVGMYRFALTIALLVVATVGLHADDAVLVPQVVGEFWQIAGDPDLGKYAKLGQQPVDFGIWQAADGTWQLWSCIRGTAYPGKTRLFYRWQGTKLTDQNWEPKGIAMEADPNFGETEGGLQAPYVLKYRGEYLMFYGDFEHICLAKSGDGKTFTRMLMPDGKAGMFSEGFGANTRDPMALLIGDTFYLYYTAFPNHLGADYLRTSKDLRHWSASKKVAFGGAAGANPFSAECPFVYYHRATGLYYLFRTQRYGQSAQTSVYRSKDPTDFGIENDQYLVGTIPYAAAEIIEDDGNLYIAVLLPSLKGIQIARLNFAPSH